MPRDPVKNRANTARTRQRLKSYKEWKAHLLAQWSEHNTFHITEQSDGGFRVRLEHSAEGDRITAEISEALRPRPSHCSSEVCWGSDCRNGRKMDSSTRGRVNEMVLENIEEGHRYSPRRQRQRLAVVIAGVAIRRFARPSTWIVTHCGVEGECLDGLTNLEILESARNRCNSRAST